jgi:lipoprotein-anchoring transpeptidase ErfK/SrfK
VAMEKRVLTMRNVIKYGVILFLFYGTVSTALAQYYDNSYYPNDSYNYSDSQRFNPRSANQGASNYQDYPAGYPSPNLQYDSRDAERILQEQMAARTAQPENTSNQSQPQMYDDYYGHRIHDEGQIQRVLLDARDIGGLIRNKNGKAFIIIDKRNYQFYLYNRDGGLLRIGPVAIGKGKTHVGAFETPVGVFPIKSKTAVDDWVRPDWYFIEEREPIPSRWEDRRVPGFFRYKLVVDGSRYIHYAEATGGRLTHGCLGLDWQDAEAVFHTLSVGSYCIVIDNGFLTRLARGEFPVQKPVAKPDKPESETTVTARADPVQPVPVGVSQTVENLQPKSLPNLW